MSKKEKILIIKLGALGDFMVALGRIMAIREHYADAEITLMTHKSLVAIGKQTGCDHFIIDNRVSYLNIKEQKRILDEVIAGDFDRVINLQPVKRTQKRYLPVFRWMMPHSFIWTDGYNGETIDVKKKRSWSWGTATTYTLPVVSKVTDLSFLHGENKHFDELPEKFVTLIPGCSPGHPHKRWPIEHFSELAQRLADKGIHSVIIGTKAEEQEIAAIAAATPMAVNMMNKTSIIDLPDLARRALASVGNDTGPSHITALSGQPMIALYATRKKPCSIKGPQAINIVSPGPIGEISVDTVMEALAPFINQEG